MTQPVKFPKEVASQLKWYVYRLIDPRNGETFYVGKGKGDRVFQHLNQKVNDDAPLEVKEDSETLKYQRIKDIGSAGLDVMVVIHRHGIEVEDVAYQIEAALIDAYPGLTNIQGGKDSGDYGCRGVLEVISQYQAEEFVPREKTLLISIGKSYEIGDRSIYDATRAAWRIDTRKADDYT